jgi:hypothetical protein
MLNSTLGGYAMEGAAPSTGLTYCMQAGRTRKKRGGATA